jgi:site-specific DNA-methyltransferase (adenine-specific)
VTLDYQPRMAQLAAAGKLPDKAARDLDYQTPEFILEPVRAYFGGVIPFDPATTPANPTKAASFCCPDDPSGYGPTGCDGLAAEWHHVGPTFVNPPYGREMRKWLAKIAAEAKAGAEIIALLPVNRTEQGYMHEVLARASCVCWIRKRVAFIRPSTGLPARGNPYASMLLGFNVNCPRFWDAFRWVGLVRQHVGWLLPGKAFA